MAKKAAKKKVAKKAVKKAAVKKTAPKKVVKKAAKKAAKKAVKKVPAKKKVAKKAAKKVAKKATKKAAKKAAPKKQAVKKASSKPAKKAPAKKSVVKKASSKPAKKASAKKAAVKAPAKKAAVKVSVKKAAKKVTRRTPAKKKEEEIIEPPVVKRAYVKPEKVAKLTVFQKKQQKNLMSLRDEIMDMMYGMQKDTIKNPAEGSEATGSGMHQADAGTDSYDRDFALNLLSKEADAVNEIESALQRLELGTYGICEASGDKIPQARLEAIPFARLTVEEQSKLERQSRDYQVPGRDAFGFN
ncbi:MAG: TraR/DksA family transcriptional regulator [Verrucomicrobiaceae bacterium]